MDDDDDMDDGASNLSDSPPPEVVVSSKSRNGSGSGTNNGKHNGTNHNNASSGSRAAGGGKLHFVKFETSKVDDCIDFIESKGLHRRNKSGMKMRVKATGGGAYKFADKFRERLGLILEREDEMACMVDGCNFLLRAVQHEVFSYENSQMTFVEINQDPYPYLLVNIGSGVSMVKVDGPGKFQRVSGTNIGGGTFWGLCRLLTGKRDFDEILKLSMEGDNSKVDLLVGDIYGGRDYTGIGLSANTIASSFGKAIFQDKELPDYSPADIAMSLCRMISYNIGQLAYLNAKRYNLSRILFGGFFIRGHPYTMETISFAIRFWSKGEMAAMFLRHEGFLGSVGAFMKVQAMKGMHTAHDPNKVRARFVERFTMGAPVMGGEIRGPAMNNMSDKITWVEKFIAAGQTASQAAKTEHEQAVAATSHLHQYQDEDGDEEGRCAICDDNGDNDDGNRTDEGVPTNDSATTPSSLVVRSRSHTTGGMSLRSPSKDLSSLQLHVGILHFTPSSEPFPLLADASTYQPNTIDINNNPSEMAYWAGILKDQVPTVVEKAASSEGGNAEAIRRAQAFGRALDMHLTKIMDESGAYGQLGLVDLFEMREECLREFGFADVYKKDKARENAAALEVLPDLLAEIDALPPPQRLLALIQGLLAGNIFDWGAKATVDLYQNATILEMYREARTKLSRRPWRVDDFDELTEVWFSKSSLDEDGCGEVRLPYKRVIAFVDNAGADVVLGMIPLVRELLRCGSEVVLVANSRPAINDITASELKKVVNQAAEMCPIIRAARDAAVAAEAACGGRVPPVAGFLPRVPSTDRLASLSLQDDDDNGNRGGGMGGGMSAGRRRLTAPPTTTNHHIKGMFGESYPSPWQDPRLYIVASGHGSPCLDLRRVSSCVADATVGSDLIIIEGMGRAIHSNYYTMFKCDALKLAMIKNAHLAEQLFNGQVYDCVCRFDRGEEVGG
jgi:bifunctional damage-control phosphatase, subfamily II, fusion protein